MQDIEKGLSDREVALSREKYGANVLREVKKKTFFKCYLSNFSDPIIRVLLVALFINIAFMIPNINWFESGGIAFSVLVSTLVSTYSEYSSENAFEKLREQGEGVKCAVIRNGEKTEIPPEEIVVKDILFLDSGVRIQADGEIISGKISVDESMLTGESAEIIKNTKGEKIYKGSFVRGGSAFARVTSVGENTYYGKAAKELTTETRASPLKERLTVLAKAISKIGYVCAVLIGLAYLFNAFFVDTGMNFSEALIKIKDVKFLFGKLLSALTLAISVVVVAVPEGLPMMITVVLSSNMKKMLKDNVIVRKPVGIETSGNSELLFTDRTGTITEGVLKVKEMRLSNGKSEDNFSHIEDGKYKSCITLCATYCGEMESVGGKTVSSNQTDRAILKYVGKKREGATVIDKLPFDSAKKYCATVIDKDEKTVTLFKGAPEKIIAASTKIMDVNGNILPLTSREQLISSLSSLTSRSYRVVAMAIKEEKDTELSDLTFLCLVALKDKVRGAVPKAVKTVTEAGIGVVMITGDNKETAKEIARECGIISAFSKRDIVITGDELNLLSDGDVAEIMPKLAVVARALPTDKSRLVKIAQNMGYVVGMTGDGINDASSLKLADVGFAMGSGTEVAKEAGDIIIADNNFNSICKAILYGRTIFESIRRFIVFQLTMNFGAMGISLIGPFIGVENPVTVSQMLWVNIIMDTLGALAFAAEPPLYEYMKNKPKRRDENILDKKTVHKIAFNSIFILFLCIWFLKSDTLCMILHKCDDAYILSGFFAMFCFMSVFVCFISRTDRINIFANISKNRSFISIMLLIFCVQIGFIYFGGKAFRSVPLIFEDLVSVVLISSTTVVFDLIRKLVTKKLRKQEHIKALGKISYM